MGQDREREEMLLTTLHLLALQWLVEKDFYNYSTQKVTKDNLQCFAPQFPRSYLQRVGDNLAVKSIQVPGNFLPEYVAKGTWHGPRQGTSATTKKAAPTLEDKQALISNMRLRRSMDLCHPLTFIHYTTNHLPPKTGGF